ncbi:hypothetical protein [Mixta intestinalis]|uniref:Uncharacterized protein n=1 Tax=Mixta intestinalis TaxID=1615494 RepID=A0A6P1PX13_9GAMM|nr:hypothetical protein [Mixta intestinalis]QHM71120.1 hypothetical protein C7M51_01403 [Mixta intestinalis]
MSERPDHNKPFPDDHKHHGLPEVAPHAPNPYEEDDFAANGAPDRAGEIPRKRDDSSDDKDDPYDTDGKH